MPQTEAADPTSDVTTPENLFRERIRRARGLPAKNQSDDEDDAFRYNVMRVTKLRTATASRPLAVVSTAGTAKPVKPSEAIDQIRRARTARRRALLDSIPPASPFR